MKKGIITLFLTFFANSTFAYNIYLINDLPADSINQDCNAILSFSYFNPPSSSYGDIRINKSYSNNPLLPGKRRVLARNRSPEVLELGYVLIYFERRFVYETKCIGYAIPRPTLLLKPELLSTGYRENIELTPTIDTRPMLLGNEVFETVSVKLKVSRLAGAEFNLTHLDDVARIFYIVKRKSTSTDSVNITKGVLSNLRQRPFST